MKFLFLQLAALGSTFILPDEQVSNLQHVEIEGKKAIDSIVNEIPSQSEVLEGLENAFAKVSDNVDDKFHQILEDAQGKYHHYADNSKAILDDVASSLEEVESELDDEIDELQSAVHKWTSSATNKLENLHDQDLSNWLPQGHHHHHKPNKTIYQLISENKYTKKLAELVNEYDDLVNVLNGTAANYTLFAPTDRAFKYFPHKGISKEVIKKVLKYHVSAEFYPVGRILTARTIPTLMGSSSLGKSEPAQRLSTKIGLRGVTINFFAKVIGVDKFGTNGVVHLLDSFIMPPPRAATIIDLAPSYFSTLELGLVKTGLFDAINATNHRGGTLFAPSNSAFEKLSPELTGFLYSKYGLKYLKAILKYHVVPNNTLYSDAFYKKSSDEASHIPKGHYHVDLQTLLDKGTLSIDIARFGRLIEMKINAYDRVAFTDVVADDGVIHVLTEVLFPPKKLKGDEIEALDDTSTMTVDELKERLDPYLTDEESDRWEEL